MSADSTYPLDFALGLGTGNTAHWAGNTVTDISTLTPINQTIDWSAMVATGYDRAANATIGYGTVIARTLFNVSGRLILMTNDYYLGPGELLLRVETTATNLASQNIAAVRVWTGTVRTGPLLRRAFLLPRVTPTC